MTMTQWLHLIAKNLVRSQRRTLLTLGAMALALFVFLLLYTVIATLSVGTDRSLGEVRVAAIEKYSGPRTKIPLPYASQMAQFNHVQAVTPMGYTVLTMGESSALYAALLIDPVTYRHVFASTAATVPHHQYEQFIRTRNGMLVGSEIMKKYGWRVGDRVEGTSLLHNAVVPLVVCGSFGEEGLGNQQLSSQLLIHLDYYEELRGASGAINLIWLRLDHPSSVLPVMQAVETYYASAPQEVNVETESTMISHLASFTAAVKMSIQVVAGAVLFTILIVTTNTMALSMRERRKEIAVMKAIGFTPQSVVGMVVAESIVTALVGGSVGTLIAYGLFTWGNFSLSAGLSFDFYITTQAVLTGFAISIGIGILGGLVPAYRASRVNVIQALSSL